MIVPLKAGIVQLDQEENFTDDFKLPEGFDQPKTPRYEVELVAYDTDSRAVRTWRFGNMEDKTHDAYRSVGETSYRGLDRADVEAMRTLRDELDKVLEDDPTPTLADDWGIELLEREDYHDGPRISVRGRVVDEDVDERGDYVEVEREEEA